MWLYLAALLGLYFVFHWYRERQTIPNLPDKYVLITGCDSGFGNQLARQLDRRGMWVLATCLTQKGAEQLKEATSQRLQTVILDVTNKKSVAAMAQWVKEQVGDRGLWGLVNNAGVGLPVAPNEWLTLDDFMRVLMVNLIGLIDVTLVLLPLLRKARGRIINMASALGRLSIVGGGYCISKFGVEAFSDSLRRDLSSFGVKVSIIETGFFKTGIAEREGFQKNLERIWSQLPSDVKESYGEDHYHNFQKCIDGLIRTMKANISLVTDCMEHGLTSLHPRTRYTAGWDAKLLYIPLSYFPTILADYLLTKL
ncbi:retinol dehydrogenase 7-like [Pleurodeles waltl]|uniref:retinol dehydrogenase 7-like n=1 Tax=Pleurodeles waltl TaxID=8319 RepID=UPI0037096E47